MLPDHQAIKIPTQMFIFHSQQSDRKPDLSALIKLRLGDTTSREYISFYYNKIAFNPISGFFNLDADDQDLTLNNAWLDDRRLKGRYHSANGQSDGEIVLFFCGQRGPSTCVIPENDAAFAGRKELGSLAGSYQGVCPGAPPTELKIETSKWHHSTNLVNNPLPGYRITGRLSRRDASCGSDAACVKVNFSQGTYNFYSGFLRLTGQPSNYNCHTENERLICQDHCVFTKTSTLYPRLRSALPLMVPPVGTASDAGLSLLAQANDLWPPWPEEKNTVTESVSISEDAGGMQALAGSYTGYLFHDDTHKLQPLKLNIQLYSRAPAAHGTNYFDISLSAALFFGQGFTHHQDFITVDFKRRLMPVSYELITFDSRHDVILNFKTWDKNIITGEWISKSYGLVGPFHLERFESWHPPTNLTYISSIPGFYQSKTWGFELTTLGDHELEETESLIFPLPIHGNAQIPGLTGKYAIVRGSYDFYGNSVALELDDGRIVVGETRTKGMRLFWPPRPIWGVVDNAQTLHSFKRSRP